ncbi:alpha/beta hydrolase [Alkalimonas amylolytica]|uniref:Alpha/beta hydrolase fold n=1 Tax=Alkalimonas amylolytica TaxID=152573 RepID=A0A1H3ZR00_ALKAM|nr:alpha/beta hydrolase [Alkalimonas amylolytica]SEA25702.1 alpha/beta hydrolase fold [Alkalimonas amylolytica]
MHRGNQSWLRLLLQLIGLLLVSGIAYLSVGAFLDPSQSTHAMLSSVVWATFGPHLVLLAAFVFVAGVVACRKKPAWLSGALLAVSVAALAGSSYITVSIITAVERAGGTINMLASLHLQSMQAGGPDEWVQLPGQDQEAARIAIYRPAQDTLAPVLVYIHGGGFKAGSITETDRDLRWFADRGWLVFSLGYRLWTEQQATWQLAPQDVYCASVWVQANASRYGGDTTAVAVLGDSAGGNLALNLAYQGAPGELAAACPGPALQAAAVVVQYPAVDPLAIYQHGYPVPGFEPTMLVAGYLGGDPYQYPQRVAAVSSYSYLHAEAPATLIFAPEKDGLVPSWSVYRFADYARLAGVEVELVRIPFASHIYNQMAANSLGNQARLSITKRFLQQQGLAPLPAE